MPTIVTKNLPSQEERREIGKKARAIYEPLREKLAKERWGEYITINLDNGDHAVAPMHKEAVKIMRAKYPGVLFYTFRIGYRAFASLGRSRRIRWRVAMNTEKFI